MEKGQTCSKWQMWIWWHGGKVANKCGSLIKESLFSIPMLSILHAVERFQQVMICVICDV